MNYVVLFYAIWTTTLFDSRKTPSVSFGTNNSIIHLTNSRSNDIDYLLNDCCIGRESD
jgi:hypothetical protein